jgi:hypothetical protein
MVETFLVNLKRRRLSIRLDRPQRRCAIGEHQQAVAHFRNNYRAGCVWNR